MRVLVATDISETSPELITTAGIAAQKLGAELTVLHVFNPETYAKLLGETGMPIDQYVGYLRAELRDQVAASCDAVPVRIEVVEGRDIARAILAAASRNAASLIVIGTRARTGLAALLGRVAETVLRHATCPVLVVPAAAHAAARRPVASERPAVVGGREWM